MSELSVYICVCHCRSWSTLLDPVTPVTFPVNPSQIHCNNNLKELRHHPHINLWEWWRGADRICPSAALLNPLRKHLTEKRVVENNVTSEDTKRPTQDPVWGGGSSRQSNFRTRDVLLTKLHTNTSFFRSTFKIQKRFPTRFMCVYPVYQSEPMRAHWCVVYLVSVDGVLLL